QRPRQSARAGADLDHGMAGKGTGGAGNAARQIEIENEVLAKALARHQLQAAHDLAEGRQPVGRGRGRLARHGAPTAAASRRPTSLARRRAAMKLLGRALPLPASANAVPWSGEVRTNGRPRVILTPRSKAKVLSGISAWSWYMATTAS